MSIEVDGVESTSKNMKALAKKYSKNITEALVVGGQLVRGDAIKSIQQVSAGEAVTRYTASGGSYDHTVAKEGDAPNTDTGRLVSSLQVEVKADSVYVGTDLDYAKFLEFGDHPFLVPALQANKKKITKLLSKAVKDTKK